jgi:tRNA-2-methylthio-N6-dimethylallyladenosine synthase
MGSELVQISVTGQPHVEASSAGLARRDLGPAITSADPEPRKFASRPKTFYIETFGCQMNVHDSEKVAGVLMARGLRPVENDRDADLVLYNTCSIREKAAQKVYSRLGAFRKDGRNTGKIIGVLGCVAQHEGRRIFERAPHVSLVCGSTSYPRLADLLDQVEAGNRRVVGLSLATDECFETELTRRDNPFRSYITIIEGCDERCAFCVVPVTRGRERSRSSQKILAECRRLVEEGYSEIQLLGQIVNHWTDSSPARRSFAELLSRVAGIPGVRRVRFATSHPRYFTPEIVRAIETHPALCDQIHLPVQSGSSRVLERMQRGYTREEYLEKINCIRSARRAISISTDIIVGFCGETREDFEQTVSLLDAVEYDQVFSFKFSPRPNTAAVKFEDTVLEEEKGRRLAVLQEHQRQIQLRRNQALIGREFEVLVEAFQPRLQQAVGRTTSNRVVNFPGQPEWIGRYVKVHVTAAGPNSLVAVRADQTISQCAATGSDADTCTVEARRATETRRVEWKSK